MISTILAQAQGFAPLVGQLGLGGALLWVLVVRLDRIEARRDARDERNEHVIRGLSKAIWFMLAGSNHAEPYIRDHAKKIVAEMDAEDAARKRS